MEAPARDAFLSFSAVACLDYDFFFGAVSVVGWCERFFFLSTVMNVGFLLMLEVRLRFIVSTYRQPDTIIQIS